MSSSSPSPSPSPSPSRKRERSPTPSSPSSNKKNSCDSDSDDNSKKRRGRSSGSDDLAVEVCKEFTRNGCRRAEVDCKFAHPHSAVSIRDDKVTACVDSLRNKCFRGRACRYYHPPPHIQQSLFKAISVEDPKVQTVCKDFMRGRCLRAARDCRFAHHSSADRHAVVRNYAVFERYGFPQIVNLVYLTFLGREQKIIGNLRIMPYDTTGLVAHG